MQPGGEPVGTEKILSQHSKIAVNILAITGTIEFPTEHFSLLGMLVSFFVLYIYIYIYIFMRKYS